MRKRDPGPSPTPLSLGTLFHSARRALLQLRPGWGGNGSSPHPAGFSALPTRGLRSRAKLREGGRACRELERLGALREEAPASGKAWFAKLTLTLTGFAKPKPERGPSLSGSRISPSGWLEPLKGPRSSPGDPGLKAGARVAAGSPGATVSGPKPILWKCAAIAYASWVSSVFRGFPGGREWRAEPPGALRGD